MLRSRPVVGVGIVLAGAAVFVASWVVTGALTGDGSGGGRPKISAIATPSVPLPPAWPQSKGADEERRGAQSGEGSPAKTVGVEEESESGEAAPAESGEAQVEAPDPSPPRPPGGGSGGGGGAGGGGSGGGWVTGGQVGG